MFPISFIRSLSNWISMAFFFLCPDFLVKQKEAKSMHNKYPTSSTWGKLESLQLFVVHVLFLVLIILLYLKKWALVQILKVLPILLRKDVYKWPR
jgi:hypothetical protein